MTPLALKIQQNGKVKDVTFKCPSCWEECTTGQYIRIMREWEDGTDIADRDYYKLLNILLDGNFVGVKDQLENQVTLLNLVGWVISTPLEVAKEPLPKVLNYQGKLIDIPRDPRELSIGQNIYLRRDYIDKSKKLEENIAIATAIYLQPIIDKSLFNIKRAEQICKEIEQMPISLIYPIGFFLLERALKFGTRPGKPWSLPKISLKQIFARMLADWRKYIS